MSRFAAVALKVEERDGVCYLIASGELVAGDAENRLNQELESAARSDATELVVDLRQVPYIDSSVLGKLVYGHSLMKEKGGSFKLRNPSPRVMDLLKVTRLVSVFKIIEE